MSGAGDLLASHWAIAVAGLVVALLLGAQLLLSLRQNRRLDALTAQISETGNTLERDAQETQEATNALRDQLGEALTRLREARDKASRAESANQAKSAFVAMVSHELRTPLSAIIGFSELIEQQAMGPIGNTKYRDYATDIRESGQHLLGIINDILDLSKVESGKETLKEDDILPETLVGCVEKLLNGRGQEAGVAVVFDCPEGLPAIRADKRRLTQILVNLMANGIKFTPAGGEVSLSCWATEGSGFVFQVVDNGVGIAHQDIPKAMSVFGQVDNDLEQQSKGTGLGLPLAKALAELHGGTLDLQSELGSGTTVTLRLPARRILAQAAPRQVAAG
jgi:signal transduction histidine kinase